MSFVVGNIKLQAPVDIEHRVVKRPATLSIRVTNFGENLHLLRDWAISVSSNLWSLMFCSEFPPQIILEARTIRFSSTFESFEFPSDFPDESIDELKREMPVLLRKLSEGLGPMIPAPNNGWSTTNKDPLLLAYKVAPREYDIHREIRPAQLLITTPLDFTKRESIQHRGLSVRTFGYAVYDDGNNKLCLSIYDDVNKILCLSNTLRPCQNVAKLFADFDEKTIREAIEKLFAKLMETKENQEIAKMYASMNPLPFSS